MYSIILYLYPPFIKTNHDQTIGHPNKLPPQPRYWIRRYSPLLESGEDVPFHPLNKSSSSVWLLSMGKPTGFWGRTHISGNLHMDPYGP